MKWALLGTLMIAALLQSGCENPIGIDLATSPDLRIQVWDRHYAMPYENAFVQVYLPGGQTDGSHTNADGWTQWLLVPRNAERVQISISYEDRNRNPHTDYFWVSLKRGDTEARITISTYAP